LTRKKKKKKIAPKRKLGWGGVAARSINATRSVKMGDRGVLGDMVRVGKNKKEERGKKERIAEENLAFKREKKKRRHEGIGRQKKKRRNFERGGGENIVCQKDAREGAVGETVPPEEGRRALVSAVRKRICVLEAEKKQQQPRNCQVGTLREKIHQRGESPGRGEGGNRACLKRRKCRNG